MNTIKSFRFPLDLQMFAGEQTAEVNGVKFEIDDGDRDNNFTIDDDGNLDIPDEDTIDDEDDEEVADIDPDSDDDQSSGSVDLTEESTKKEQVEPQKKENTTASAVIAERKKWQAKLKEAEKANPLIEKLMKLSGITSMEDLQARLDAAEADNLSYRTGITPEQAQLQIQQQRRLDEMEKKLQNQNYDGEVLRLKADPFFADIDNYREEFQEIAARTGQTLEQVYFAQRGKERMKEREREIEQTLQANRSRKQASKVDTSVSGEAKSQKSKINLTADERAIAKLAGISEADYYKNKKK